jgi:hypothetical protein
VAVNCCVKPLASDGLGGVTEIEASVAELTVREAGGVDMPPKVAVILVEPAASALATPELLMVATAVFEEAQAAVLVRSAVLPSV